MTFTGSDRAAVAADGEAVALETISTLEPDPTPLGGRDVMSRTAHGWTIRSAVAPGYGGLFVDMRLFSPDLSLVGVDTRDPYNPFVEGETTLDVGPVGGPYTRIADIPAGTPEVRGANNRLAGANEGTESVPAFSVVLFESTDHELLSPGRERELVEGAPAGEVELYESSDAGTRLVNVEGQGASMKLVEEGVNCGVQLGAYSATLSKVSTGGSIGAVSNDGSKVFFTTSVRKNNFECEHQPSRLWMRVGGRETVEVSAPEQGVTLEASERSEVFFKMATADGSKVFFETATP
ncbi:MAG TPA: hypothetical protein VNX67_05050, partial [Solirubrobacteraceae bacterium]|nr:hypothetical protein [Solirubrobacteraceae bacterium]